MPVSPSSPHAPDLSTVRACPGRVEGYHAYQEPALASHALHPLSAWLGGEAFRFSSAPGFLSLSKLGGGWGLVSQSLL